MITGRTATVFDISRFCLNDGAGICTTVFLKGCPLRCVWCHNPESQNSAPELLYSEDRCINCGSCAGVCPKDCHAMDKGHIFRRNNCTGCGACVSVCGTEALRLAGRPYTAKEVLNIVLRDRAYYKETGGGLTVSGGEPMMQIDFLEELFYLAKGEGLRTNIETCGYAPPSAFVRIAPLTDCFLFDWKESDPKKHRFFTGADNQPIRENLALLNEMGAEIVLRLPLIPGYNDSDEHREGIAAIANRYKNIRYLEILPYHPLGIAKERELGRIPGGPLPHVPNETVLCGFISKLREQTAVEIRVSK